MFFHRGTLSQNPSQVPGVRAFAILSGIESVSRGILISVFPVSMYRIFEDAQRVSEVYFMIGVLSMLVTLLVPWVSHSIPRRWLYTLAVITFIAAALLCAWSSTWVFAVGLALFTLSGVVIFVCFNAYIMDYVNRVKLGECQALQLFYSGAAWTIGPFLGIWLMTQWKPAPFILSAIAACLLLAVFWYYRLGNGKAIHRGAGVPPNPFAYLYRFLRQPRLVSGWTFAVMKSSGWWVYILYLPIYAVENGHSEQLGGALLSLSNAFLFLTPLIIKTMRGRVRLAIIIGFLCSGTLFLLASTGLSGSSATIALLVLASLFMILLDVCAGLPFLMAVRPSQRTEMSAVYSTYRDVSGVITPGAASLVLMFAPLKAIFGLTAAGFFGCAFIASKLHPRLGMQRYKPLEIEPLPAKATSG
ncbi:MAG: MFS transporter [Gammaproteobacteria bacterium]|nr:MFS transporter [Gammaproteobacteria bacterium]MDH3856879.1 MFS transporter [Gammaproteobacteria bacterium]